MRGYRSLQRDETLQVGDERMSGNGGWKPAEAVWIGQPVPEDLMRCFRRPVNLPVLQPVTPEAMAELEGAEIRTICVLSQGSAKTMTWKPQLRYWLSRAGHDSPLEWDWFIELSTIPEGRT